jgi:hypothetical protein
MAILKSIFLDSIPTNFVEIPIENFYVLSVSINLWKGIKFDGGFLENNAESLYTSKSILEYLIVE